MARRSLDRCNLDAQLVEKLDRFDMQTAQDLIEASPVLLMAAVDVCLDEALKMRSVVCEKIAPKPHSALELHFQRLNIHHSLKLSTGFVSLDLALRGGLLYGSITDIVGPPGIGKSQVCMATCLECISQSRKVLYFDTEFKFDASRLANLARAKYPAKYGARGERSENLLSLLDHVKVVRPTTCRELLEEIQNAEATILSEHFSLVIIDSIAALARQEALSEQEKEEFVVYQASLLLRLADLCHCVVLVTNQVVPVHEKNSSYNSGEETIIVEEVCAESGSGVVHCHYRAALGSTWSYCVGTRLTMSRRLMCLSSSAIPRSETITASEPLFLRELQIVKSPIAGPLTIPFEITECGLTEIST